MLHTPPSAGILPKREVHGKAQGSMSSLRPRRAFCHSDADLGQEMSTSGSGCGLEKVPSWYLYWPHIVRGSRDSVQAQMFGKLLLDLWEGRRGLCSQGESSGYPGVPPDLFCTSQDSECLLACYFGLHKSIPLGPGT